MLMGGDGIANRIVFTPVDKGPSQPDLTQDARKMELSGDIRVRRLPSPTFVPDELYQKVSDGEQPVAFREKGSPVQAVTILTTCEGAGGKVLILKLTSFEASTHVPIG